MNNYDKKQLYDNEISELISEINSICQRENIPYFFTCAITNSATETKYQSEMLSAAKADIELSNDVVAECLKLLRGYHAVPKEMVIPSMAEIHGKEILNKSKDGDDILEEMMHVSAEEASDCIQSSDAKDLTNMYL